MSGVSEDLIVSQISEHLRCSICLEVIRDAVFHLSCQSGFCRLCLTHRSISKCPICRGVLNANEVRGDRTRNELIAELECRCPGHDGGCTWVGEVQHLAHHVARCGHCCQPCSNAALGCSAVLSPEEMITHTGACRYRKLQCECGVHMFAHKIQSHRNTSCPSGLVTCRYGCGQRLRRRDLPRHDEDCEYAVGSCPHADLGCAAMVERRHLLSHLQHTCAIERTCSLVTRFKRLQCAHSQPPIEVFPLGPQPIAAPTPNTSRVRGESRDGGDRQSVVSPLASLPPLPNTNDEPTRNLGRSRFVWRIPHFTDLTSEFVDSSRFTDPEGGVWYCRVYPNGDKPDTLGNLTFGAYRSENTRARYCITIPNHSDHTRSVKKSITFTSEDWQRAGWGWRRVLTRDAILTQGFLHSDALMIIVDVEVDISRPRTQNTNSTSVSA